MLMKTPKSGPLKWLKRGATVLFIGEAIAFAVSYGLWYSVNTRRGKT